MARNVKTGPGISRGGRYARPMTATKTGGRGGAWIALEPKPPRVADHYEYWGDEPPERSERCAYWLRQIERGWRPNRRIAAECYDCSAQWYGVWIWEYVWAINPALRAAEPDA